jgi:predicted secreted acid phosphatase|tara:strand:- start:950 stop:1117 length:168 start_codon:yes stop_codon:yes gene_type:complete
MGIEQQYISIRTKQTVDEAISNYKKEVLDEVKKPTVVMKKTDDGWEMSIGEVDKK